MIVILGVGMITTAVRTIFGMGRKDTQGYTTYRQTTYHGSKPRDAESGPVLNTKTGQGGRKKVIGKDEGEYVEFEEVKD